jgi:hypothetical protein
MKNIFWKIRTKTIAKFKVTNEIAVAFFQTHQAIS